MQAIKRTQSEYDTHVNDGAGVKASKRSHAHAHKSAARYLSYSEPRIETRCCKAL